MKVLIAQLLGVVSLLLVATGCKPADTRQILESANFDSGPIRTGEMLVVCNHENYLALMPRCLPDYVTEISVFSLNPTGEYSLVGIQRFDDTSENIEANGIKVLVGRSSEDHVTVVNGPSDFEMGFARIGHTNLAAINLMSVEFRYRPKL